MAHAHGLELLHSGDEHFDRLVGSIDSARREINIEMYQIRPDPVGWRLCTALGNAALRGVRVRLMLDRFGSAAISGLLNAIRSHGVELRWYRDWRPWRNPFRRTHRKLIVIDGHLASVGGINFAAEFSERHTGAESWRDFAIWMEGPTAWLLRRQFQSVWGSEGGEPGCPLEVPGGSGSLCAVCGGRNAGLDHAEAYLALVESARSELLLATPYLFPDHRLRGALSDAVNRGVRVVVVVPRFSDLRWFKHGSRRRYDRLLRAGVEIWERCDRMVHAKAGVADGLVAAVGSTNLNRLSFYGNLETLVLTHEASVVTGVRQMIVEESARQAEAISLSGWPRHRDRSRLAELAAYPMSLLF
jgi:cardiolipin synthase